jgi:predicted oxidoreductase
MLKDSKFLKPLETGPYYVVRAGRYCDCSQGGITVDEKLRVLKENGEVIPGLYAMGDNAGGFVSEFYFGGAGATFSLTSGYMSDTFFKEYLSNL